MLMEMSTTPAKITLYESISLAEWDMYESRISLNACSHESRMMMEGVTTCAT